MFLPFKLRTAFSAAALVVLGSGGIGLGAADHLPDMDYPKLEAWSTAQGLPMPRAAGITVSQAEGYFSGELEYLPWSFPDPDPDPLEGQVYEDTSLPSFHFFYETVFTANSSGNHLLSPHANTVGKFFYGNITSVADDFGSMAPDVLDVGCYYAVDYIKGGYGDAPLRKVQSNAWVAPGAQPLGGFPEPSANTLLRDLDEAIDLNGQFVVAAVQNDPVAVPELLASGYNSLSVGRSTSTVSTGTTPGTVDGAGRMKPEVVAPYVFTSYAAGGVSSLAALLYGAANDAGFTNAFDGNEVVKAIIMAGATKDEPEFYVSPYTGWSRTLTAPVDERFGAGEVNAYWSYRILAAGEQNAGGAIGFEGWDFGSVPNGSPDQDYSFSIPAGWYADELSVVATWNRFKQGMSYVVHDLNLRLLSADGSVEWERSDSALDNFEHIHYRNLPPGDYVFRLTRNGNNGATTDYGLAWRIDMGRGARIADADYDEGTGDVVLTLDHLDPLISYTIERASSLEPPNWMDVDTFSPAPPGLDTTTFEYTWTDTAVAGPFQLYRLRWDPRTN